MIAHGRHRRTRSPLALWCTAAVLCLLAVGIYFRLRASDDHVVPAARDQPSAQASANVPTTPTTPSTAAAAATVTGVAPRTASAAPLQVSPPVHLTVASIGVNTDLQRLKLAHDGSLQAPTKWDVAGWYADGIVPGQTGPAVIAGHIDSTNGPAVFYRLGNVVAGARISVTQQNGKVLSFVVDEVREYPKDRFPTKAVYGPTPTPELRLISCTGEFDHSSHNYLDNLVVSAHLA